MVLKADIRKNTKMQQNTYILYMMIGSYFKSCKCRNRVIERQLFLYYKDMPVGKQERAEEEILKKLDCILGMYEQEMSQTECIVKIRRDQEDRYCRLFFLTDTYELVVDVDEKGVFSLKWKW